MILRATLMLLMLALPAAAQTPAPPPAEAPAEPPEQIVAGLSRDDIDITTNFD